MAHIVSKPAACKNKLCGYKGSVFQPSNILSREKIECPVCGFKTLQPYLWKLSDKAIKDLEEQIKKDREICRELKEQTQFT